MIIYYRKDSVELHKLFRVSEALILSAISLSNMISFFSIWMRESKTVMSKQSLGAATPWRVSRPTRSENLPFLYLSRSREPRLGWFSPESRSPSTISFSRLSIFRRMFSSSSRADLAFSSASLGNGWAISCLAFSDCSFRFSSFSTQFALFSDIL